MYFWPSVKAWAPRPISERSVSPTTISPPVNAPPEVAHAEAEGQAEARGEQHGQRGAIMIVEMADPSKIPALAEPWFLTFNASVEFRVVMTPDDLQKAGLDEVGRKWA